MGIVQTIKNFFTRSKYVMTAQNLTNITDHPKIAVSSAEYDRIRENLKYYAGHYPQIEYIDSNGTPLKRAFNHLPIGRTAAKKIASLVFNEQAEIKLDDKDANSFRNSYKMTVLLRTLSVTWRVVWLLAAWL